MTEGELRERLEYEFRCMKMGFLIGSRENIFQHAEEIAQKTRIYRWLRERLPSMGEEEREWLSAEDCLIDALYGEIGGEEGELYRKLAEWLRKHTGSSAEKERPVCTRAPI